MHVYSFSTPRVGLSEFSRRQAALRTLLPPAFSSQTHLLSHFAGIETGTIKNGT
jgi:hypothetical protein